MVIMQFLIMTFQEHPLIVMWKRVTKPKDHIYHQKAPLYQPNKNQDKTAEEKVNAAQQYRETQ